CGVSVVLQRERVGRCFVCGRGYYDSSSTGASIGVRLAFKTSELAAYCGRQFLDIWADFVFLPEKKSE
ncbi:MAG: hypothetical protein E6834_16025, partial [Bacteroides ovatus]|nr:hypothetical protein [Bacteroides ovatus]